MEEKSIWLSKKHCTSQYPIKYHRPRNGKDLTPNPEHLPLRMSQYRDKKIFNKVQNCIYNYKICIDISPYFISSSYFCTLADNLQKLSANTLNLKSFPFPLPHNTFHLPTNSSL